MAYTKNDPIWSEGVAPGISAARLNHLETQYDEAIATLAAIKAGSVTDTTDGAGLISVVFGAAFGSTPIVVITLRGNVDYYAVVTAVSTAGFTAKILKTAHIHTQGSTGGESAHVHSTGSLAIGAGSAHKHSNPNSYVASAYHGNIVQANRITDDKYCASTSGGSPTTAFVALSNYTAVYAATHSHYHTLGDTGNESSHIHAISGLTGTGSSHVHTNPSTASANAGNALITTEVTFAYIAMIA